MQMANNTTQQHLRQPTFPFSRKNDLPHVHKTSQYYYHMLHINFPHNEAYIPTDTLTYHYLK